MEAKIIVDFVGWFSTILFLAAYILLARKKVDNNSYLYHSLNFVGGIGFGAVSAITGLWFIFLLEIFWSGIAFLSLIRIYREKKEIA